MIQLLFLIALFQGPPTDLTVFMDTDIPQDCAVLTLDQTVYDCSDPSFNSRSLKGCKPVAVKPALVIECSDALIFQM